MWKSSVLQTLCYSGAGKAGKVVLRAKSRDVNKVVLHTGDFRFGTHLLESSRVLRRLASNPLNNKQLIVYLDTTYCDPAHRFPPQDETLAAVQQCVGDDVATMAARREASAAQGMTSPLRPSGAGGAADTTLYVFGAYGIGTLISEHQ